MRNTHLGPFATAMVVGIVGVTGVVGVASGQVLPTLPHAAYNFVPFGQGTPGGKATMHQVFDSALFAGVNAGGPVEISSIAFAPADNQAGTTFDLGRVDIALGYTNAMPGAAAGAGGLAIPVPGQTGAPNVVGSLTTFYDELTTYTVIAGGTSNFEMEFAGTPFVYNPALGNLLVSIVVGNEAATTMVVSRTTGSTESSRAYSGGRFTPLAEQAAASRMLFTMAPASVCYADCDGNGVLNIFDYICFGNAYATGCP